MPLSSVPSIINNKQKLPTEAAFDLQLTQDITENLIVSLERTVTIPAFQMCFRVLGLFDVVCFYQSGFFRAIEPIRYIQDLLEGMAQWFWSL